jgi:Rha family phage regulatory protein
MQNLEILKNDVQITSVDIAELTGKKHFNVLIDIRNEIEKLGEVGGLIFQATYYTDKSNRQSPCYSMGKKGAMQLALKYDAVTRYKVIERIEELENTNGYQIPQTYAEALRFSAQQIEENEKLQLKIEQDKPYTEYGLAIADTDRCIKVNDFVKTLNNANIKTGRNRLFKWLREEGILCSGRADYNRPKQMYIDMGIFKVKQNVTTVNGANYLTFTPLITGKGQKYLFERIKKDMRFEVLQ